MTKVTVTTIHLQTLGDGETSETLSLTFGTGAAVSHTFILGDDSAEWAPTVSAECVPETIVQLTAGDQSWSFAPMTDFKSFPEAPSWMDTTGSTEAAIGSSNYKVSFAKE